MMGWKHTATAMLMGAIAANVAIVQVVDAKSLTAKEVYDSANQFVVKIGGDDGGSGFIVRKNGNRYTVLTNDHVTKTSNEHTITTHDGKTYTSEGVRSFKSANGLDLAEIEFESNERYQVAKLASRPNYSVGAKVYAIGWNATNSRLRVRESNVIEGTIAGSQSRNTSGYTLTMNLIAIPGMSGSPLLDDNGKVIGIYAAADRQTQEGRSFATSTLGIQISNYRQVTSTALSVANETPSDRPTARKSRAIATENSNKNRDSRVEQNTKVELDRRGFKLVQTITLALPGERAYESSVISPDGNIIAMSGGRRLQIRRVFDGVVTYNWEADSEKNNDYVRSLAISTNGQILAIGTDRGIQIRRTSNGEVISQIDDEKISWSIAMSGDGSIVAGSHLSDTIKFYRVSDGQIIQTITAKNKYLSRVEIGHIEISPNGKYIASNGRNDGVRVWQISDGKLIKHFDSKFYSLGFSLDSNLLFVAQENPTKINPEATPGTAEDPEQSQTIKSWTISNDKLSTITRTYRYKSDEFANLSRFLLKYQFSKNNKISVTTDNGGKTIQIWRR
jgi:WD40 repeat protein